MLPQLRSCTFLVCLLVLYTSMSYGQDESPRSNDDIGEGKVSKISAIEYAEKTSKKLQSLEADVSSSVFKSINEFERIEKKLRRKLSRKKIKLPVLLSDSASSLAALTGKLKSGYGNKMLSFYEATLDTTNVVLAFLKEKNLASNLEAAPAVKKALDAVKGLKASLERAREIRTILRERKHQLSEELANKGMGREILKLNKMVFYYSQRISDYNAVLTDKRESQAKLVEYLRNVTAFKNFFARHSELSQLFPDPGTANLAVNMYSLQTRAALQEAIETRINLSGGTSRLFIQQQMQQANSFVQKLKTKAAELGSSTQDFDMPDFKPNYQKGKPFAKRLEPKVDLQTTKHNSLFPVTSDIGLGLGYRLNDKSSLGIGLSYRMGWGKSIREIQISHQGLGLRSFFDWKFKGTFYLAGGFERDYTAEFKKLEDLQNRSGWNNSALLGISKKYGVGKRKFETKMLFDFLYKTHLPITRPILFRFGYSL